MKKLLIFHARGVSMQKLQSISNVFTEGRHQGLARLFRFLFSRIFIRKFDSQTLGNKRKTFNIHQTQLSDVHEHKEKLPLAFFGFKCIGTFWPAAALIPSYKSE